MAMFILLAAVATLALLDAVAQLIGKDSRDLQERGDASGSF